VLSPVANRLRISATVAAAIVIVSAAVVAYAGSLRAPFIFDDFPLIVEIRPSGTFGR